MPGERQPSSALRRLAPETAVRRAGCRHGGLGELAAHRRRSDQVALQFPGVALEDCSPSPRSAGGRLTAAFAMCDRRAARRRSPVLLPCPDRRAIPDREQPTPCWRAHVTETRGCRWRGGRCAALAPFRLVVVVTVVVATDPHRVERDAADLVEVSLFDLGAGAHPSRPAARSESTSSFSAAPSAPSDGHSASLVKRVNCTTLRARPRGWAGVRGPSGRSVVMPSIISGDWFTLLGTAAAQANSGCRPRTNADSFAFGRAGRPPGGTL